MGKGYEHYGYPHLCGWIEALLTLNPRDWTQSEISLSLSETFSEPDKPTSLASVNRAIKVLEQYGVVEKSGSRKRGYIYRITPESTLIEKMFQNFVSFNGVMLSKLTILKSSSDKINDKELSTAIEKEIRGYKLWDKILKDILNAFQTANDSWRV